MLLQLVGKEGESGGGRRERKGRGNHDGQGGRDRETQGGGRVEGTGRRREGAGVTQGGGWGE